MARAKKIDFPRLANAALSQAKNLLARWLPDGERHGHEYKATNPTRTDSHVGSFSVNINTGAWADFATDDRGGDLVSLHAYLFHAGDQGLAAAELARELGLSDEIVGNFGKVTLSIPAAAPPEEWAFVAPVPDHSSPAPVAHIKRGKPEMVWAYLDAGGRLLGYVYRFKTSDGGKEIIPCTYWRHVATGREEWKWKVFPELRPLYGLYGLEVSPDAPVLVVEGEKCADAAAVELPALVVMTWPGGSGAVDKTDWTPLFGRKVITWADCDSQREKTSKKEVEAGVAPSSKPYLPADKQPGAKAMAAVRAILAPHCRLWNVEIPGPGELASGYDVADMIADGTIGEALAEYIRQHAQPVKTPPPPAQAGAGAAQEPPTFDPSDFPEEQAWRDRLLWNKGCTALEPCLANVFDVLANHEAWAGVVAFDEFAAKTVKLKPPPYALGATGEWEATDDARTAIWLTRKGRLIVSSALVAEAVETLARASVFHPVRAWLASLPPWDGIERTPHWLQDCVGVPDSPYVRLVGTFFLRGMIARVMRPGVKFDYCLVLEGRQGKGKSSALRVLAGEWFADTDLDLNHKDSMGALAGVWLYEFAELGSVARAEASRQKSFLSRQSDKFRPVYGRRDIILRRQVVFAGTTNDWEWIKDPTGGRRFWPVECTDHQDGIDLARLAAMRDQLFAEALHDWKAGARFWPTPQEQRDLFDPEQLKREQPEGLVDALHDWVDKQFGPFSVHMAITEGLKLTPDKLTRDMQIRVGIALRKLGCNRHEKRNGIIRYWWTRPMKKAVESANAGIVPPHAAGDDGGDDVLS